MVSYSALRPVEEKIKGVEHVVHTIGIYPTVIDPFVQYISNAIDAGATDVHVNVLPDRLPNKSVIVITDNGHGMSREKLASIPSSIGSSDKTYAVRSTGEHPKIGLHAFGEYAYQTWVGSNGQLTVISRPRGYESYNVLVRRIQGPREGVVQVPEYGHFRQGTRVIVSNVRDDVINLLKGTAGERRIRENLSDVFDICLRKDHVKIYINGESWQHLVPEMQYRGELLLDESIPVEYVDEIEQRRDGEVQLYVVGNTEGAGRVRLCLQDARVLKSVSDVAQIDYAPFNATVLGGYFNSMDVLWPTGEKHGVQIDENRFPQFKAAIESRKDVLEEAVRRLARERDETRDVKANELINQIFRTDMTLRFQNPSTPRTSRTPRRRVPRTHHRTVRTPLAGRLTPFPLGEADKLSKLEGDIVYINSAADDYLRAVDEGQRAESRYLLGLLSKDYAFYKLQNVMEGGTQPTADMIHASQEDGFKLFLRTAKRLKI